MTPEHLFIEAALAEVGQPYIWGGKGDKLWTPKGMVGNPFDSHDPSQPQVRVFDCSGLVLWALLRSTGEDKRGEWNAQVMFDGLKPAPNPDPKNYVHHTHLRFYGKSPRNVSHVAIWLGNVDHKPLVIEAAGGDHTTTSIVAARERRAEVRCGFSRRTDELGVRVLPL
jgi:cell wall-associated NlpC family hydrolase